MAKPMVYHLNNQLFDIFQQEIKELHQDIKAVTMEKFDMKLYYEDLISDEQKEKEGLLLVIQDLKEKLKKAEAKNQGKVRTDDTTCCPTMQKHQEEMKEIENKYLWEIEMLTTEFEIDLAVAQKEIDKLQKELQHERELCDKSDLALLEANDNTNSISNHLDILKKVPRHDSTVQDEDIPYLDVKQLQEMLQKQIKLVVQAENENLDQFKYLETFFEEMEQKLKTEKELRAQTQAEKHEVIEIAENLFEKLADMEKISKECTDEINLDDRETFKLEIQQFQNMLQKEQTLRVQAEAENANLLKIVESIGQEMNQELQKERSLREETEKQKLEIEKVSEKLFQALEKACKMTEKLSTQTKVLTNKLQVEHKKQEALLKDVHELTLTLEKEKALRLQAENYEMEAMEFVDALQKETEKLSL